MEKFSKHGLNTYSQNGTNIIIILMIIIIIIYK